MEPKQPRAVALLGARTLGISRSQATCEEAVTSDPAHAVCGWSKCLEQEASNSECMASETSCVPDRGTISLSTWSSVGSMRDVSACALT